MAKTPEQLHTQLLDRFCNDGLACAEAAVTWLVTVDMNFEPPHITLVDTDSGRGFVLDGASIQSFTSHDSAELYADAQLEADAIDLIASEFGS